MKHAGKDPSLLVREDEPFNAEPTPELLRRSFITPNELFFVRNHGSVPDVDLTLYRLLITGSVKNSLNLSLGEIRNNFAKSTVTATLECAGNRRSEFLVIAPIPGELPWDAQAIGNAIWGGAPLREVLLAAGLREKARHVVFTGLDEVEEKGKKFGFGGSIPIEKAISVETLLAYELNGDALLPTHGFPLRAIVPGYIGARSVKWLANITVQAEPSANYFQSQAYKLFPPQVNQETVDWAEGLTLGEIAVNSVICYPQEGETLMAGPIHMQGCAIAGGERRIERVDISVDGGEAWVTADLGEENHPWAWRLWEVRVELRVGSYQIVARAWDSAANTQPEDVRRTWNFKGYMNNAWHRVKVRVI